MVAELKLRQKKGENVFIRNGKIVTADDQPFREDTQSIWEEKSEVRTTKLSRSSEEEDWLL